MKKVFISIITILVGANITLAESNIAVVDINKVVSSSTQVKALKTEQQAKIKELETWLVRVKSDIEKQSTKENKEKLIKKYDAEFVKKQEAIKDNYLKKSQAIDKTISQKIEEQAKAKNYDVILTKSAVLYGGEDITKDVIKAVK